jgi:hypothetical protein
LWCILCVLLFILFYNQIKFNHLWKVTSNYFVKNYIYLLP